MGNHSDGWPQPWSGAKGGGKIFVFPLLLFRGKRGEDKTADGKMGGEEGMEGGVYRVQYFTAGGKSDKDALLFIDYGKGLHPLSDPKKG